MLATRKDYVWLECAVERWHFSFELELEEVRSMCACLCRASGASGMFGPRNHDVGARAPVECELDPDADER